MPAKKRCSVSLCKNNSVDNPGVLFHRFPAKRERFVLNSENCFWVNVFSLNGPSGFIDECMKFC